MAAEVNVSLAKYVFHKPEIMKMLTNRQKAIRAVREHVGSGISERLKNRLGAGGSLEAFSVPGTGKVVKKAHDLGLPFPDETASVKAYYDGVAERAKNELRRRAYLKHVASKEGISPETFLVDTNKNRYLVQDELSPVSWWDSERKGGALDQIHDKLKAAKISINDLKTKNVGQDVDGSFKALDLGSNFLKRSMPESERKEALQRFIQKNRKKDWLKD